MTRPIDDKFEYNGQVYKVVKSNQCILCAFNSDACIKPLVAGFCCAKLRDDEINVIFSKSK